MGPGPLGCTHGAEGGILGYRCSWAAEVRGGRALGAWQVLLVVPILHRTAGTGEGTTVVTTPRTSWSLAGWRDQGSTGSIARGFVPSPPGTGGSQSKVFLLCLYWCNGEKPRSAE